MRHIAAVLAVVVFFSSFDTAFAKTIAIQADDSVSFQLPTSSEVGQILGSGWEDSTYKVRFRVSTTHPTERYLLYFRTCGLKLISGDLYRCSGGDNVKILDTNGGFDGLLTYNDTEGTFTGNFGFMDLDLATNYQLAIQHIGSGSQQFTAHGSSDNTSFNCTFCNAFSNQVSGFLLGGIRDLSFSLGDIPTATIAYNFPTDQQILEGDFAYWVFDIQTDKAGIYYIRTSFDSPTHGGSEGWFFSTNSTSTITQAIAKTFSLQAENTYTASSSLFWFQEGTQDFDFRTTGIKIADSDTIAFLIGSGDFIFNSPDIPEGTGTFSTSTALTITCDTTEGFFAQSFCNLAVFLFVPKKAAFTDFKRIYEDFKLKPPLGYFTIIEGQLSGLSTSTQAFALTNITGGTLRTYFGWALYLFLATAIFRRFKRFDL